MTAVPGIDFIQRNLIGRAPRFVRALDLIERIARSDATVLIKGETGTGKELAARAIHYLSGRRTQAFVPVNCGAIPDTLVESEFFGHVRGAFTDAKDTREGVIAQARGGTLFLDELEALSPRGQVVLLRFLQDQIYKPVGGADARSGNVRILGSTNVDLNALAAQGQYRRDLVFRLCVLGLDLPALRDRPGDARLLADAFLQRYTEQYALPPRTFGAEARRRLDTYPWPGNVRELENVIHREVVLSDRGEITLSEVEEADTAAPSPAPPASPEVTQFCVAKARAVAEFERAYVADLLTRTHGNLSQAARLAGKDRSRLGKLVKKYGIERHAG